MAEITFPNLDPLLNPKSIAVIGASENRGPGRQVIENLRQLGFEGGLYPVNPKYDKVLGLPCYPSLTALKDSGVSVDLAAIVLGRDAIIPTLKEGAGAGIKAAWAFASGFGEAGDEGKSLQRELLRVCRENNILFCGPNCVGFLNPTAGAGAYSAPAPRLVTPGPVGIVAQSGYLCIALANSGRQIGISTLCSTGNEAVLDASDYIAHLVNDPATRVIAAFIEQFRNPGKLAAAARMAEEKGKPIIVLKVGRSELARSATAAHTGALAGADDIQDALFRKLGIIRVDDLEELLEAAELFSKTSDTPPRGNRIFGLTLSGGIISLLGDLSENLNIRFPAWSEEGKKKLAPHLPPYAGISNPLDAWGYGRIETAYPEMLATAAEEKNADALLVVQDLPPGMAPAQVAQYMVTARSAAETRAKTGKPVVVISNTAGGLHEETRVVLDDAGVPLLQGTRPALRAVSLWISHAERRRKILESGTAARGNRPPEPFPLPAWARGTLTEYRSKEILREFGIPCTEETLCATPAEAAAAAGRMGYPVALKVMSPDIPHKTEAGALALNIKDEDELEKAFRRITENARRFNGAARIDGVLCQGMVTDAVAEAFCGVIRDPDFGPAVVFGMGGIFVEILRDRKVAIPPLSRDDAAAMIRGTAGYRLLEGFRGRPRGDIEELVDTLVKVGDLALRIGGRLRAADINPLMVLPEGRGVRAADALLILEE